MHRYGKAMAATVHADYARVQRRTARDRHAKRAIPSVRLSESLKFRTHIAFEIYAFENFERNVVFERNDVYVFERNGV